jgi:Predicted periplasmic or secreted lipoprotein
MENDNRYRSYQDQYRNPDSDWQNRNWDNERESDRFRWEQNNRSTGWNNDRMEDNYGSNRYSSYGDHYGRYGDDYNRYGNRGSGKYDETYWTNDYDRWNRRNYENRNYENTGYSGTGYDNRRNVGGDRDWWDRTSDEISSWFGDEDAKRRRRMDKMYGPHRGKGPKGYTRSDEKIKEDISERLYHDSYVDASDIDITVSNGDVTLSGTVDSREAKHRAEDIADSITGVKDVSNHLKVNKTSDTYNNTGTTTMNTTTGNRSGMNGITDNNDNNRKRYSAGV